MTGFRIPKSGLPFFPEVCVVGLREVCFLEYFGGGEVEVGPGEGGGVIL